MEGQVSGPGEREGQVSGPGERDTEGSSEKTTETSKMSMNDNAINDVPSEEQLRQLVGTPPPPSTTANPVPHNGRVYVHYTTTVLPRNPPESPQDIDADSLADDTESSATTVVCDARFHCATPEQLVDPLEPDPHSPGGPDTPALDTLDAPASDTPEPESEVSECSLSASPSASATTSPDPPKSDTPQPPAPHTQPHTRAKCEASPIPDNQHSPLAPHSIATEGPASLRSSSPSLSSGMSGSSTAPDLPEEQVAAYLDRHPHVVDKWLRERAPKVALRSLRSRGGSHLSTDRASWDSDIRDASACATPTDTQHLLANYSYSSRRNSISSWMSPKSRRSRKVERLTEPELFMELIRDISTELDIDTLCHKILVNVGHLTHADRASLFLTQGPKHSRTLVAKLFDVTVDTVLEEALSNAADKEIVLPWGVGIVGHVASTKEVINIRDAYQDPRFDASIDRQTGYRTMSVLCMPVCNFEGEVIGVAEIINKKNGTNEFTPQDVEVFRRYLTFCGIGIQNAQLYDMSVREYKRNQLLLQLARGIFEEQTSLDRLVTKIMREARELLKCERCSVFLLDPQIKASSDDGGGSGKSSAKVDSCDSLPTLDDDTLVIRQSLPPPPDELLEITPETLTVHMAFELQSCGGECSITQPSPAQLSSSFHARLANYVLSTGQTVNISDVVEWLGRPLEDQGLVTHSVLTIPIFNSSRKILGVAQLINKENGLHFTEHDINTFEAFAIFCGLGIQNTQVYEKACRLMARQQVALECLSYHATASQEDTDRLRTTEIPSAMHFDIYNFDFCDIHLTDDETLKCAIRMFVDLDFLNIFHIPYEVLCRWLLSVKKNYRPVRYHNWRHALTVAQTMFAMLKTGKMEQFMTELEMLGLLVACLCHDLDHRGTNNSFQTKTDSPLAILYSTSTMEHHHFDQCVMILSQDANNIFQSLPGEGYRKVMTVVESAILSTDMAMYFKKKDAFLEMSDNGEFDWQSDEKKQLLCGIMMTACDVSAIAKPWEVQHKTAKMVADEFFEQGDLERLKLNQQPMAMMDREKKDELPKMQVGFIGAVCLPLYKALSESFPWVKPLHDGCQRNQEHWKRLAEQVDMGLTWIDHEYIERPVERNDLEVLSKITLNSKQEAAPQSGKSDGKSRLGLTSALRGARKGGGGGGGGSGGGGKRRSVEKRSDRVMDSTADQRRPGMSPKHELEPFEDDPRLESGGGGGGRGGGHGGGGRKGRTASKLRSRLCVLL